MAFVPFVLIFLLAMAHCKYDCDLIQNASVQLPGIAYKWDYPLPINVCMSAYQNNGNYAPYYSSEIFECSANGDQVTYSYFNGSANCVNSTLKYKVNANYSNFECGNNKPCPFTSVKTYFVDTSNTSKCEHLEQYNQVSYVVDVCMELNDKQSTKVQCSNNTAHLMHYFNNNECHSATKRDTTLNNGCNVKYNTWADVQCP